MIVCCPACQARIRIDHQRLAGKRISLRCVRCREIFKAEIPAASIEAKRLQVLLAHADMLLCTTIRDLLAGEAIDCRIAAEGDSALQMMQARPPQVAILDVAIPGLYIFELIEKMKSHPLLAETRIILLSSVYSKTAYKRTPSSLYGADAYIEKHHIPGDLLPKIYQLTTQSVPLAGRESSNEGKVTGQVLTDGEKDGEGLRQISEQILRAENEELSASGEWKEKAARFARMIAADIALYSQEKMDKGVRENNVFEALATELEEGRRLFRQRMEGFSRQHDFVREAFAELVERRKAELQK
jgi:predicted Zn finger-like uncharacterized protein